MKLRRTDRRVDILLAEGRLSGSERERILAEVLERSVPGRRRGRWAAFLLAGAGGVAAVAAAMIALFPGEVTRTPAEFAARGLPSESTPGAPTVEIDCLGAALSACPIGSTLMFVVRDGAAESFLAAAARPAAGGPPIWYFSGDSESPRIAPAAAPHAGQLQPVSRGIRLGPEHAPGAYRIEVVLSAAPLSRAALASGAAAGVQARRTFSFTVTGETR